MSKRVIKLPSLADFVAWVLVVFVLLDLGAFVARKTKCQINWAAKGGSEGSEEDEEEAKITLDYIIFTLTSSFAAAPASATASMTAKATATATATTAPATCCQAP